MLDYAKDSNGTQDRDKLTDMVLRMKREARDSRTWWYALVVSVLSAAAAWYAALFVRR